MATKIRIRNDFTGLEIVVDPHRKLTRKKIRHWRSKLCAADCTSGDTLGGRGRQDDPEAYSNLLDRAELVVFMHRDER